MSIPWKEVIASFQEKKFSVFRHDEDPKNLWLSCDNSCGIHYYPSGSLPHTYDLLDGNILVLPKHIVWQTSGEAKSEKIEVGNIPASLLKVTTLVASFLEIDRSEIQKLADCIWKANCMAYGRTASPTPLHIPHQPRPASPASSAFKEEDAQSGSSREPLSSVARALSQHSRTSHSSDEDRGKREQTLRYDAGRQRWWFLWPSCFGARK